MSNGFYRDDIHRTFNADDRARLAEIHSKMQRNNGNCRVNATKSSNAEQPQTPKQKTEDDEVGALMTRRNKNGSN